MFWRQPKERTPASKPKGHPERSTPRRPVLLPVFDGRAGRGADGAWWRDGKSQLQSCLFHESPDASGGQGTVRALLLPPLLPSSLTREAGARGNRQPADRDNHEALGTLLGELLPDKFRHFLHQLRAKSAWPEADPPSAPQYPSSPSEHCPASRCSSSSFLPDFWDQPLHWDSFREKTTLGLPKGEFVRAKKANPPSGEGSRPRRRYCPFRVRFADETLQDTALRYWERNRAVRQNIFPNEQTALPAVSVSAQEPQLYLSEDATVSNRLPFISRASIPRPRGGLRTFLDTPNSAEQESFLPSLVLQTVLKQGRPKGYQLLLPSTNRQQAHR